MGFYKTVKKTLTDTVDAVVDKTATSAQKNRLRLVMRNEAKIANQAYIELGKYLYNNLRENLSPDLEELCTKIDTSRQRMSRAQQRYREVLQEELVNKEITKGEVKESLHKIKEPIAAKAKDAADKVSDIKDAAVEKASELKERLPKPKIEKIEVVYGEVNETKPESGEAESESANEIEVEILSDESEEASAEIDGDISVREAIERAVTEAVTSSSVSDDTSYTQPPHIEYIIDDEDGAQEIDEAAAYDTAVEKPLPVEIYSYSNDPSNETASEPIGQEFQRTMPVDISSEDDFEELEEKKASPTSGQSKARRLREIISGENSKTDKEERK